MSMLDRSNLTFHPTVEGRERELSSYFLGLSIPGSIDLEVKKVNCNGL